jgi:hypothetical protein
MNYTYTKWLESTNFQTINQPFQQPTGHNTDTQAVNNWNLGTVLMAWHKKSTFTQFYNPYENLDVEIIVSFKGRGDFQTVHTQEMQTFHHPSLQTFSLDWIQLWHESILGEGRTEQGTVCDSNKCEVTELAWKTHSCGHKLHIDILFCPLIIRSLGQETDLLLWYCQAKQKRHATRPSTEDNKSGMRRHSHKNQWMTW